MPKRDDTISDAAAPSSGTVTIEADSVEEAMARLANEVGDSAEIVDARKVQRGGIGGFFAKERVQLVARAGAAVQEAAPEEPTSLAGVLDRMTRDAEAQETQFATMLRRELGTTSRDLGLDTFLEAVGWDDRTSADEAANAHTAVEELAAAMAATAESDPTTSETAPTADLAEPAAQDDPMATDTITADEPAPPPIVVQRNTAPTTVPGPALMVPLQLTQPAATPGWRITAPDVDPAGMGAVAWRTMDLVRRGIPTEIVAAVDDVDPNDDIAWISALAAAVAPYCGSPAQPDSVLIGPEAAVLADALGIETVAPGQTAPYEGSFASPVTADPEHRNWLEFVRGLRVLHCVIGADQGWRQALFETPRVVSWLEESGLVDALYLAVACDAQMAYGALPGSNGALARIYPVDVALAIRSMMERS